MSAQPTQRVGLDIIEALDDAPLIAHAYCAICQPVGTAGSVIVARCGHSKVDTGDPGSWHWPAHKQVCTVCHELWSTQCDKCGSRP